MMRARIREWESRRVFRFGLAILILLSCLGCDQTTKSIAREELSSSPPISLLGDVIRLELAENPGAMLGLGSSLPPGVRFVLLTVLAGASLLAALGYAFTAHWLGLLPLVGLSLLAAGGVGNLIDRILNRGVVTDFVRLGIGPFRTGIFNVADVAIVAGVAVIAAWSLRTRSGAPARRASGIERSGRIDHTMEE